MPTSKKIAAKITKKPATATPKSASAALEGKKAPAFELLDADGKTVALKQLIGSNNLVLYFYPKDMTPGCTIQAYCFPGNIPPLKKIGPKISGISRDSDALDSQFIRQQQPH